MLNAIYKKMVLWVSKYKKTIIALCIFVVVGFIVIIGILPQLEGILKIIEIILLLISIGIHTIERLDKREEPVRSVLTGSGALTKQVSPQGDLGLNVSVNGEPTKGTIRGYLDPSASEKSTNKLSTESIEQVAAVCYRQKKGQIDYLLILTSGRRWMFPKGKPYSGEPLWRTAEREAHEEAGASGQISHQMLTTFRHLKQELKQHGRELIVAVFLLKVDTTYEPIEKHRNPTWFTQEEAKRALSEGRDFNYAEELKRVVTEAYSFINTN